MTYTGNIYKYLCSTTSEFEITVDTVLPLTCPYHGGAVDQTNYSILNNNQYLTEFYTLTAKTEFKSSSYELILSIPVKSINDAVLREVNFVANKHNKINEYRIRMYDTNNNTDIFETIQTNDNPEFIKILNISNQSLDETICEFQGKVSGTSPSNRYIFLNGIRLIYEKI